MARAARVARRPVRRGVEPPVWARGRALDPPTRSLMEARFAHHFGDVRVHADAASVLDDGAVAYTAGRHIVFAPGAYAPRTEDGRWLIAHELAHVVQQERADTRATAGVSAVRFETDADRAADAAVHGGRVSLPPAAAVPSHQRVNTSIVAVRSGTLAGQAYTALGGGGGGMLSLAHKAPPPPKLPAPHAAPGAA